MKKTLLCDYCNNPAELVTGKEIYPHRPDLSFLQFWRCEPCAAYVGCHKGSDAVPLGRLANEELRVAKKRAHSVFDPIWKTQMMTRSGAYQWLATQLGIKTKDCHIGMFDIETCRKTVDICACYINEQFDL